MKIVCVIPARYASSRFPGKALADLNGKPVLQHVWTRVTSVLPKDSVVVATDDFRIATAAQEFGARAVITNSDCLTGSDRVAEVARKVPGDWYLNVQGDEPFISIEGLRTMLRTCTTVEPDICAVNAMAQLSTEMSFRSVSVPKVVVDSASNLLYISRAGIPCNKSGSFEYGFRQIGLYAFRPQALDHYGLGSARAPLERLEDIEILRLIEAGIRVRMVTTPDNGPAIDTPEDLDRARTFVPPDPLVL